MDGSQKNDVFTKLCSNEPGIRIRDGDVPWGSLPLELWAEIGKRLMSRLDTLRFRSVCKQWRSSLPSPTLFPLKVPPPPPCYDPKFHNVPFLITEVSIYNLNDYLVVSLEEVEQGGRKLHARYLKPKELEFDRPMISFIESSEEIHSSLRFDAKAYHLRMAVQPSVSHGKCEYRASEFVKKTVLISSNGDRVNPSYARASDLSVVVHMSCGRLALLRLRGYPESLEWDTDFCDRVFECIADYKGRLAMLDGHGRVFLMDYDSLQMTQVCDSPPVVGELEDTYLCGSCGNLYLADFSMRNGHELDSYKLCLGLRKWLEVEDDEEIEKLMLAYLPFLQY